MTERQSHDEQDKEELERELGKGQKDWNLKAQETEKYMTTETPGIAMALIALGVLSILSGVIMAVVARPGLTWLLLGLVTAIVYFAFAAITTYLCSIRNSARILVDVISKEKATLE